MPTIHETITAIRQIGATASYDRAAGEYRVNLPHTMGGDSLTAYFTNDAADALATARAMIERAKSS